MRRGWVASEAWKAWAVPWKLAPDGGGQPDLLLGVLDGGDGVAEGDAGREVEGQRDGGNWPWWLMASGVVPGTKRVKEDRGTCAPDADFT